MMGLVLAVASLLMFPGNSSGILLLLVLMMTVEMTTGIGCGTLQHPTPDYTAPPSYRATYGTSSTPLNQMIGGIHHHPLSSQKRTSKDQSTRFDNVARSMEVVEVTVTVHHHHLWITPRLSSNHWGGISIGNILKIYSVLTIKEKEEKININNNTLVV